MSRTLAIVLVSVLVAAACGGDPADSSPSSTAAATSSAPGTTQPDDPAGDPEPAELDAAIAEQLMALETANDGQWTVDTALDAVRILRPIFLEGFDGWLPIDSSRLFAYLAANFDQVPQAGWDEILAAGPSPNARLVGYQTEAQREAYQLVANDANAEFERLSGHTLGVPIYVALSDLVLPFDFSAATWTTADNPEALRVGFGDEDLWQEMADAFYELTAAGGAACIIVVGGGLRARTSDRQAAGMVHEVVHCHQHSTYPGGRDGFYASPTTWMDEGYAAWAGEAVVGGTRESVRWWNDYFSGGVGSPPDGFSTFESGYTAMVFFSHLAAGGSNPYRQFVPWFSDLRSAGVSNSARFDAMAATASADAIAGWAASASRRNEWGSPWDSAAGPGVGNTSRSRRPATARVGSEPRAFTADPGEQRYWSIQFNTAPDGASVITVSTDGPVTIRWDWEEQYVSTGPLDLTWCVGEDCTCEDGTTPVPGALPAPIAAGERASLDAAIVGLSSGARVVASLTTLEDECEEEEEPTTAGPLDACLFGTWNPGQEDLEDFLLTLYRAIATGVTLDAGTIDLNFGEDGSFSQVYNGIAGSGTRGGVTYEMEWSGGSFGTWEASGGVLTLNFTGSNIGVVVNGVPATAPSIPEATVEAGYSCDGSTLTVDPPPGVPGAAWPLPREWFKAG
jgi:hypothetical protein